MKRFWSWLGLLWLFAIALYAEPEIGTLSQNAFTRSDCGLQEQPVTLTASSLVKGDGYAIVKAEDNAAPKCPNEATVKNLNFTVTENFLKKSVFVKEACEAEKGISFTKKALCLYQGSTAIATFEFTLNTKVLETIEIKEVAEGDEEITVTVEPPSDTTNVSKYQACAIEEKNAVNQIFDDPKTCSTGGMKLAESASNGILVDELVNGTTYLVKVRTVSEDGKNTSPWSTTASKATPQKLLSVLNNYDGEGGIQCSQSSGSGSYSSLLILFSVFGILLAWRRKKFTPAKNSFFATIFVTSVLFYASRSDAYIGQINAGITFSPYFPHLDSEIKPNGGTIYPIYKNYFGSGAADDNGPWLPLFGLELNVKIFDSFGTLTLGGMAQYTFASGNALKEDGTQSNVPVGLHLIFLKPQLYYFFDYALDYFPLFPYVRAAFAPAMYIFTFQRGLDKRGANNQPIGFQLGFEGAAGVALQLDFLEPRAAKSARTAGTYFHTYLKAEMMYSQIDGFGNGIVLSPKDFLFQSPLPLMLNVGLLVEFP